jgi:hypothetical protein
MYLADIKYHKCKDLKLLTRKDIAFGRQEQAFFHATLLSIKLS